MSNQKGEGAFVKRKNGALLDLFHESVRDVSVLKVEILGLKPAFHQIVGVINQKSEEFCNKGC